MKKLLSIFLLVICFIGLTACESKNEKEAAASYKHAVAEMCSQNYETAYTLFNTLDDYEDSDARANECSQFIINELAEAAESDIGKALDERNSELLIHTILSCQTSPHAQAEVTDHIYAFASDSIAAFLKTTVYKDFVWFDSLLEEFHNTAELDQNFVNSMDSLRKRTNMDRSAAFLNGNWIRSDDALASGLKMEILYDDKHNMAIVTEDLHTTDPIITRAHFDWLKGMLKMQDIVLNDFDMFSCSDMWIMSHYNLGVQSQHYEPEIGKLDFIHNRILTQDVKDISDPWELNKSTIIYINQNDYIPPITLTEDDFIVAFEEPVKDIFEAGENSLSKWFSYQNKSFYVYDLANTTSTYRGISVGSSWDDVVNEYGHGKMNFFQGESDPYFKYLKQSYAKTPDGGKEVSTLFSETAQEYMQYEWDDFTIRFYFADDKVNWIFWSGKEF